MSASSLQTARLLDTARLVTDVWQRHHITPILRQLPWLPVWQWA